MQRARAFFHVCAGLFLLAASYHLGVRNAQAQAGSNVSGFSGVGVGGSNASTFYVLTMNGEVFSRTMFEGQPGGDVLHDLGNFWSGTGPVNVERHSLGQLKQLYRTPAPGGR